MTYLFLMTTFTSKTIFQFLTGPRLPLRVFTEENHLRYRVGLEQKIE